MFRTDRTATLLDRCRHDGLVIPDYEGYCFVNVPGTAASVHGIDSRRPLPADVFSGVETDVSHVVTVVLDSLGWHRWHRDADEHRFLARINERGTVTPLTSVASSSTAPAITSVHTGVPPAEHGVLGCDVYLPTYDTIVQPFSHEVREDVADGSTTPPVTASDIVQATPVYSEFEASGVETRVIQPAGTLGTAYADATFRGAKQVPYENPADGAMKLRVTLEETRGQSYSYWYAPDLDTQTHKRGPNSGDYHNALRTLTRHLSGELYDRLDSEIAAETLLIVTADHGSIPTDPRPNGCLDIREIDGVISNLRQSENGRTPPYGDPRLCHIPVEPDSEDSVVAAITEQGATALTRDELVDRELFGPNSGATAPLNHRCGDVIVFDADRKLIYPSMEKVVSFAGIHGGLTSCEMLVPFVAARLSKLQYPA